MRSVLIPTVAIPLSLVGTFTIMFALGYSINLLTLLALVLAIGLVVDDAIIVVENVDRHLEEGMKPTQAAVLAGARARQSHHRDDHRAGCRVRADRVPHRAHRSAVHRVRRHAGRCRDRVGRRRADVVADDVLATAQAARSEPAGLGHAGSSCCSTAPSTALHRRYERLLHGTLNWVPVTAVFSLIVLGSIYFLWVTAKDELAPPEDQGVLIMSAQAAPNSTLQQRQLYTRAVYETFAKHPETDHVFQLDVPGQTLAGMVLKPWSERKATATRLLPVVQRELGQITGLRAALFQPPPLPGAFGLPVQFVIQTTEPFERLNDIASAFAQEAQKSGMFFFIDNDLRYDLPQSTVVIDRELTAQLGLTMKDVGGALSSLLGGGYVNYFSFYDRAYKVIPQVQADGPAECRPAQRAPTSAPRAARRFRSRRWCTSRPRRFRNRSTASSSRTRRRSPACPSSA